MKLSHHLARGRVPLPPAWLANDSGTEDWHAVMSHLIRDARSQLQLVNAQFYEQNRALKTALLPLALVEPYLRALDNPARDAAHDITDILPLTRVWRLARAHWKGRL